MAQPTRKSAVQKIEMAALQPTGLWNGVTPFGKPWILAPIRSNPVTKRGRGVSPICYRWFPIDSLSISYRKLSTDELQRGEMGKPMFAPLGTVLASPGSVDGVVVEVSRVASIAWQSPFGSYKIGGVPRVLRTANELRQDGVSVD